MFFVCFYLYLMSNIACRFVFISYICWADEHDVLCLDSEFVFEKSYLLTNHVCISFSFVEQASKLLSHLWDCNQKIDASQTFEGTPKERFCICLDYSTYISKNATKDCWHTLNLVTEHCQSKGVEFMSVSTQWLCNNSSSCFNWNEQKKKFCLKIHNNEAFVFHIMLFWRL